MCCEMEVLGLRRGAGEGQTGTDRRTDTGTASVSPRAVLGSEEGVPLLLETPRGQSRTFPPPEETPSLGVPALLEQLRQNPANCPLEGILGSGGSSKLGSHRTLIPSAP